LHLIAILKKVDINTLLYYLLITIGYVISIISMKVFIVVTMVISNIIDIYLLGIIVVLIN